VLDAIAGKRAGILAGLLLFGIGTALPRGADRSSVSASGMLQSRSDRVDIQGSPGPPTSPWRAHSFSFA
jgi:hypothetical protein